MKTNLKVFRRRRWARTTDLTQCKGCALPTELYDGIKSPHNCSCGHVLYYYLKNIYIILIPSSFTTIDCWFWFESHCPALSTLRTRRNQASIGTVRDSFTPELSPDPRASLHQAFPPGYTLRCIASRPAMYLFRGGGLSGGRYILAFQCRRWPSKGSPCRFWVPRDSCLCCYISGILPMFVEGAGFEPASYIALSALPHALGAFPLGQPS